MVTSGGPVINLDTEEQFTSIQAAIDDSDTLDGHTIFVGNGTYYENVVVDKQINLTGENKNITIVDGTNTTDVFLITAEYVNISGFTITNDRFYNGIHLDHVGNSNINDLIITENENGILLESSSNNTIININASYNKDDGIDVWKNSDYNTIHDNLFTENGASVFINENSVYNDVQFNMVMDSTAFGIQTYNQANYNIIANNTILRTRDDLYGDIAGDAICLFDDSFHNTIENNDLSENKRGISLRNSEDNIVRYNDIIDHTQEGIKIYQNSDNNHLYHNNLISNSPNANDIRTNTWDSGYPDGGNYFDDYSGVDFYHGPNQDILGADNIGDTSYDISGGSNQDHYPLMHPWGVEGFYLNLADFPMYEAESDPGYNEMCGPAVAQMTLDYIWWNSSEDPLGPPELYDQSWLYERGLENNTNQTTPYLDTYGLWKIIQYNKPMPYSEYGYNFMKYNNEDLDEMLKRICLWINYTIGSVGGYKPGYPLHVPAVVPAYGGYTNWMAIRGFHANRTAHPMPDEITVYGFWVNDPYPSSVGGLGENSYKTLAQWLDDYYLPLETDDVYDGKYVAIFEPPQSNDDARLNIGVSPVRFTPEKQRLIRLVQSMPDAVSDSFVTQSNQWIVQAAIEGVAEQLIPYDDDFAAAFVKTIPGTPFFVKSLSGDGYYAVPFDTQYTEKKPYQRLKKSVSSEEETIIVILIDADDGSFKEASWVKDPVKYLPISKSDVREILPEIFEEIGIELENFDNVIIDLVHRDSTPYYPDWRVTIKELGVEFFIGQDGGVSFRRARF